MTIDQLFKFRILQYILLLIVCSAVYGNTFFNGWTYDDMPVVVHNSDSHSLSGFIKNSRPGRPMRELTYIPEYQLFGNNPAGYHFQQLFWHFANASLLLMLFTSLGIKPLYAVPGVLFFLIHPLQTESVANISHRKELLALFFSLVCLLAYMKALTAERIKCFALLLLASASFFCAILSNQASITFPFILVLYEYIFLTPDKRFILRRPIIFLFTLIITTIYFAYRYRGLFATDQLLTTYSKYSFVASTSFIPLWMADIKAFGFYLYKIVFPVNLAPEYHVNFSEQIFQPWAWFSALLLAATVTIFFITRRKNPSAALGLAWFLVLYLPVSNILPVSYLLADRYMYLCLPGVALLIAGLLQKYEERKLNFIFVGILLILGALTINQNSYWKDEHTLWRHAVSVNPDSTWVQETVALSYHLAGQFEKAREHSKIAINLNRYNTRAYLTLAKSEDRLGNLKEAIKNYELFASFGVFEYPVEVANVNNYLPFLRKRVFLLYGSEK